MAVQSWHRQSSRDIEHEKTADLGIARAGSRPKTASDPCPIHPGMGERTNSSIGAPPRNANSPDASSPLPTNPEKQHGSKTFPIPGITRGMSTRPGRGEYDPGSAGKVIGQAIVSGSTKFPEAASEED